MTSSRVNKAPKGASRRRHFAQNAAPTGDGHKHKRGRKNRRFLNYDRVASPDHEVIIPSSSRDVEANEDQVANSGQMEDVIDEKEGSRTDKEGEKDETSEQDKCQEGTEGSLKEPTTAKHTNAKFSGPRNLEQLKKRHDELAEYIRTMKEQIAARKAL